MERFCGKVAVVTGVTGGIGGAIAEQLVEHGVKVVGLARRKEKLDELSRKLEGQPGYFYSHVTDLTKEENIVRAFKWISENVGPVHILVNAAGIARITSLHDGSTKHWKDVIDTNLLALCITTREALKDMKENNVAGHIIHINSELGHNVWNSPNVNVYAAVKHGVTALTETLRQELNALGSKTKVTSISPGHVKTDIFETSFIASGMSAEIGLEFINSCPHLNSKDVADAAMYVLGTPPHVQIHELRIKPIGETF